MKFLNSYEYKAILIPTIFILAPFFLDIYLNTYLNYDIKTLFFGIGFFYISLYLIGDFIIRPLGRKFEGRIFNNGLDFPTSKVLLGTIRVFDSKQISQIYKKIKKNYKKDFINKDISKEEVKYITAKIRHEVGDGRLLINYNATYGMFRNFVGGSCLGIVISFIFYCINLIHFNTNIFLFLGLILFYSFFIIFRNEILKYFGLIYAKKLLEEYLYNKN